MLQNKTYFGWCAGCCCEGCGDCADEEAGDEAANDVTHCHIAWRSSSGSNSMRTGHEVDETNERPVDACQDRNNGIDTTITNKLKSEMAEI